MSRAASPRVPRPDRRHAVRQIGVVAGREIRERVRSKVFLGVLIGTFVVIVGGLWATSLINPAPQAPRVLVSGSDAAAMAADVRATAEAMGLPVEVGVVPEASRARQQVVDGEADLALVDGNRILAVGQVGPSDRLLLTEAATAGARRAVAADLGLTPADVARVVAPAVVAVEDVDPAGPVDDRMIAAGVMSFVVTVALLMVIQIFGQSVATGVIEEKQNRVVEVILAKVEPAWLLTGKVLGIGALGLAQVVVMAGAVVIGMRLAPDTLAGVGGLRQMGATAAAWLVVWFILGYAEYAVGFATLGATVSRQEDLQSLAYIPSLLLLPAYFMVAIGFTGNPPDYLTYASYVPFWTPLIMPYRLTTGNASGFEAVLSIAVVVVTIALLVRYGGRVYRGAALHVGGRIRLRDAMRAGRDG